MIFDFLRVNAYAKNSGMKNRKCVVIAGIALACILLIGGVFAVSRDNSVLSNIFGVSTYKTVNTEAFVSPTNWQTCESVPKTMTVKNESSGPVVARVRYSEEWVASDRTTQLDVVDSTTNLRMAIVDRDNVDKWLLNENDGYYYYYKELAPGETTLSFMKSVTLNCDANLSGAVANICTTENGRTVCTSDESPYASATYTLRATLDTIQANAARSEWNYQPTYSEATLLSGNELSHRIGQMTKIERVGELPDDFSDTHRMNARISTENSDSPIYMWTAAQYADWGGNASAAGLNDEDTIYWYSKATKIFYNPDMHKFLNVGSGGTNLASGYEDFYTQFDASRITDLTGAFTGCTYDLSWLADWDVSNVTSFSYSFQDIPTLTDITPLKNWNVSSAADLTGMFTGSNNITNLNELSWFNQ